MRVGKLVVFFLACSGLALLVWGEAWAASYWVYQCPPGNQIVQQTGVQADRHFGVCANNQGGWVEISDGMSTELTLEETAQVCTALALLLAVAFGFKVAGRALRGRG